MPTNWTPAWGGWRQGKRTETYTDHLPSYVTTVGAILLTGLRRYLSNRWLCNMRKMLQRLGQSPERGEKKRRPVLCAEHVYLTEIAAYRLGRAKLASKTRQLRRFVANEAIDVWACYAPIARRVLQAAAAGGRIRLLIDTLELSGQRQILMVALAYRRRAVPIGWVVQRRKGVTDSQTQIALLGEILPLLPDDADVVLIGDGEFHSVDLMEWLQKQRLHFHLRLHADTYVQLPDGRWAQLQNLDIPKGQRRYLHDVHITRDKRGGPFHLAIAWPEGKEHPWFIASDQPACYQTLRDYTRRMWIDEMFGDFQENGFHLHQSRLYKPARLSRLLLALAWVYTWLIHLAAWAVKRGFRPLIDRNDRRDLSYFQLGPRWLQQALINGARVHVGFKPYP